MKLRMHSRRGQRANIFLVIIVLVLFVAIIAGVVVALLRALQRMFPAPAPDKNGIVTLPGTGTWYDGGIVAGVYDDYGQQQSPQAAPQGFVPVSAFIYASNTPQPTNGWLNCDLVWTGPMSDLATVSNFVSLTQLEIDAGRFTVTNDDGTMSTNLPPMRFYNIMGQ